MMALAAAAAGCAAAAASNDAPREARVIVKLATPSQDRMQIAREAALRAGVGVRYAAAVSEQWHALALACADDRACAVAVARLRAAGDVYLAVEIDGKKRPGS